MSLVRRVGGWVSQLSWALLIPLALLAAAAPITPQPHLVQKFEMFMAGTLTKPIDLFDVVFHLSPTLLIAIKAGFMFATRGDDSES